MISIINHIWSRVKFNLHLNYRVMSFAIRVRMITVKIKLDSTRIARDFYVYSNIMPAITLDGSNHTRQKQSHTPAAITRGDSNHTRQQQSHATPHEASRRQQSRSIFMLKI